MEFIRKWIEMPVIVLGLALLAIVGVVSLARGHIDLRDFISSITRAWRRRVLSMAVCCSVVAFLFSEPGAVNAAQSGFIKDIDCPGSFQGEEAAGSVSSGTVESLDPASVIDLWIYSGWGSRVLGPMNWQCWGVGGSGGEGLAIAPAMGDLQPVKNRHGGITGQAVAKYDFYGGASGRVDVARFAGRYFPQAMPKNVERVIAEGIMSREEILGPSFPHDQVTYKNAHVLEFVTPAHEDGLGTMGFLAKSDLPIYGMLAVGGEADGDWWATLITVRLPPEMGHLRQSIIAFAERCTPTGPSEILPAECH
jgi:hypothetical protein